MSEARGGESDELTELRWLRGMNAVLRVTARHTSVFAREAFEELLAALATTFEFDRLVLLMLDEPGVLRLYARARDDGDYTYGSRISVTAHPCHQALFVDGQPYRCDDTRESRDPMDLRAAADGHLSYLSVPLRSRGVTIGSFSLVFRAIRGADAVPLPLAEEIAALLSAHIERGHGLTRERRLAMILATSGDAMIAWDREGRITDANDAAAALSRSSRKELIGARIDEILDPPPAISRTTSAREGVRLELLARPTADLPAQRIVVAATITAVEDDAQVAAHALLRDLSKVALAEREAALRLTRIREIEEQHRTLLDNAPLIIFRLDPNTLELQYLNRHAERLLGVPTAEAMRTPEFLRSAHADAEGVAAFDVAIERARSGAEAQPYEARMRHREGEEITVRGTVYPLLSERGELAAIEGVLANVSAERAARTRLVQADRLSTLGTLSAGVAHEINNPAAFILLGLDMLARLLGGKGVQMEEGVAANAKELLRELRDSIKRIVDIARDLRLFASPPSQESGRRTVVDVNQTVESALTLTRGQIIDRAQIERDLGEVPPVLMDDGRLGQVIVNLLVNAAQAIPKSYARENRVTITTRSDGRQVEIVVTDTGVGISPENLTRVWMPFFTTKGPDVGTGLGLSISREIIERAGGTIDAVSPVFPGDPAYGARFTIVLPAAGRRDSVPPISSPLPRMPTARARVLVVEDEASLARALADEIGRTHDVVLADGAEQARERFAVQRFDAVLCDLRMPGVSGEALYGEIEAEDPAQAERFVFMTGVGFGADVERFLAASGRPVLEKPFPMEDALAAIARVIARAKSGSVAPT